jgi:uncharacterized protein (TIGR03437 family)
MKLLDSARCVLWLAALAGSPAWAQISGSTGAPFYSPDSIVNAATQTVEALAPNTIATLYGADLAFSTRAVTPADVVRGVLPTSLDGVGVWVNAMPCHLFYISPTQINFLIPYQLGPSTATIIVARNGVAGPAVNVELHNTSPGVFLSGDSLAGGGAALAVHLNGQVISNALPAVPGEIIVLYAAGLGRTVPDTSGGQLATSAFPILYAAQLQVLLDGVPCPPGSVLYAGLAPGFAGLYQINLVLPPDAPPTPEIRLAIGAETSPGSVRLAIQ